MRVPAPFAVPIDGRFDQVQQALAQRRPGRGLVAQRVQHHRFPWRQPGREPAGADGGGGLGEGAADDGQRVGLARGRGRERDVAVHGAVPSGATGARSAGKARTPRPSLRRGVLVVRRAGGLSRLPGRQPRRGRSSGASRGDDCVANRVWFGWDGTHIRFSQTTTRQKTKNLERDPRIALSIVDPENPYRYLEIRGKLVAVEPDPDIDFISSMAKKYLGVDRYPWHNPRDERIVMVVAPEHTTQMGS